MKIALLLSNLNTRRNVDIVAGAANAARDLGVTVLVVCGKRIIAENRENKEEPFEYQSNIAYNYVTAKEFDAVVADIEEIGEGALILKKEGFLQSYHGMPVLVLSQQEGFLSIAEENPSLKGKELGYAAIRDAVSFVNNGELPKNPETPVVETEEIDDDGVIAKLRIAATQLLLCDTHTDQLYENIAISMKKAGLSGEHIFMFEKPLLNLPGKPFKLPEEIELCLSILEGKSILDEKKNMVPTNQIMEHISCEEGETYLLHSIYMEEMQIGAIVNKYNDLFKVPGASELLIPIIIGGIRLANAKQSEQQMEKELLETQEELAKDDSILAHIGETDFMTGRLNRRGFFAAAYDKLSQEFHEGTYAVVSYIDIDPLKTINDIYGRSEGDFAVKKVSDILNKVFGDVCVVGRIRGDEFAILLVTEQEGISESFRTDLSQQNAHLLANLDKPYIIHMQFSICEFQYSKELSLKEMLKETDDNLQKIKEMQRKGF